MGQWQCRPVRHCQVGLCWHCWQTSHAFSFIIVQLTGDVITNILIVHLLLMSTNMITDNAVFITCKFWQLNDAMTQRRWCVIVVWNDVIMCWSDRPSQRERWRCIDYWSVERDEVIASTASGGNGVVTRRHQLSNGASTVSVAQRDAVTDTSVHFDLSCFSHHSDTFFPGLNNPFSLSLGATRDFTPNIRPTCGWNYPQTRWRW